MRISKEKDDPGYIEVGASYVCFLNNILMKDVVTADNMQGFVKVLLRDEDGKIMIDITAKKPFYKYLFGKVHIRKIEG